MTTTVTDILVWNCDVCGKPVADGKGYICVDVSAADAFRAAYEEWKAAHRRLINLTELMAMPSAAPWHVYHKRCDPQMVSANDYWFDVERVRTDRDLLGWTAHLFGKDWFRDTNWDVLLYAAMNANGGRNPL